MVDSNSMTPMDKPSGITSVPKATEMGKLVTKAREGNELAFNIPLFLFSLQFKEGIIVDLLLVIKNYSGFLPCYKDVKKLISNHL